ncbi:hypothetical protein [Dyadobacter diqingensis]|uniref:hypothetical protein n=1 Tax=Dyadobacter diqingensis TaxID=2938121 RepID=UPI0020C3C85A|nr:hypothetical protein [Dyadobacter diqingensis]
MKTQLKKIAILFSSIFLTFACSNKEEEVITQDCEKNEYGIITVNYTSGSVKHAIDITTNGSGVVRTKITAVGVIKDTLHLKTNTYVLSIASVNSAGLVIDQFPAVNVMTSKCSERTIDTNF